MESRGSTWHTSYRHSTRYSDMAMHKCAKNSKFLISTDHIFVFSLSMPAPPLSQLDAGVHENIALYSRDEQSVLVVSYADIKSCLHSTFTEVLAAGQGTANHTHSALGAGSNKTKKNT